MVAFLAFFPSFFEAAVVQSRVANENEITLMALVTTSYGFYGLCHLLGGGLQLLGGSNLGSLRKAGSPLTLALLLLSALSLSLEAWGWFFKGSLTVMSIPGAVAGILCLLLYVSAIQRGGA